MHTFWILMNMLVVRGCHTWSKSEVVIQVHDGKFRFGLCNIWALPYLVYWKVCFSLETIGIHLLYEKYLGKSMKFLFISFCSFGWILTSCSFGWILTSKTSEALPKPSTSISTVINWELSLPFGLFSFVYRAC